LQGKPLTVGRGDDADAQIDDTEMSRRHFVILPRGSGYAVQDLKSTNGTWLNGKNVTEAALKANDRIQAGLTNFVFTDGLATIIGRLEKDLKAPQ
jgi:pSer/pThr/pTyr-binding forkhead associated (FHA) protein